MTDEVNHPTHYQGVHVEPIDVFECYPFVLGNAMKYLYRAGRKGTDGGRTDLAKARWYLLRFLGGRVVTAYPSPGLMGKDTELHSARIRLLVSDSPLLRMLFGYSDRKVLGPVSMEQAERTVAQIDSILEEDQS